MKHFVCVKHLFDVEPVFSHLIVVRVNEVVQVINQGRLLNVQQANNSFFLSFLRRDAGRYLLC